MTMSVSFPCSIRRRHVALDLTELLLQHDVPLVIDTMQLHAIRGGVAPEYSCPQRWPPACRHVIYTIYSAGKVLCADG